MADLVELPATAQRAMLARREVSARELLAAHLEQIDQRNPSLNAIVALDPSFAQRRAAEIDEAVANGREVGPLAGLVTAHKDLTETADFPTTYGTPAFAAFRPRHDSLLVARIKAAGALAVGKTNTPEWGAGSHTFNPVYGATHNAHRRGRSAGGSSGGAAAALASQMVSIADGSDMGGSLRNPAAWNGVVGFRPSRGLVPDIDPGNAWSTLAVDGPMGRTVDDVLMLLQVLAVPDHRDPMCREFEVPSPGASAGDSLSLRVAFSPTLGGLPIDPAVAAPLAAFAERLTAAGHVVELAEPSFSGVDETFETLRSWGFANGLGRMPDVVAQMKPTIRDEVERGLALDATDVGRALGQQRVYWERAVAFFERFDLLVAPVTQCAPFDIGIEYPASIAGVAMDRYITWMRACSRVTMLGLPAMSLPIGRDGDGLPVGAQLVGGPWQDAELLLAARALEAVA